MRFASPSIEFLLSSGHQSSYGSAASSADSATFAGSDWTAGAFHDGELKGLISISDMTYSKTAKVFILVAAEWRRKDIAALIKAAKTWALDRGIQNLLVGCSRPDWPTRNLLEKIGARLDLVFGEIVAHVPITRCEA